MPFLSVAPCLFAFTNLGWFKHCANRDNGHCFNGSSLLGSLFFVRGGEECFFLRQIAFASFPWDNPGVAVSSSFCIRGVQLLIGVPKSWGLTLKPAAASVQCAGSLELRAVRGLCIHYRVSGSRQGVYFQFCDARESPLWEGGQHCVAKFCQVALGWFRVGLRWAYLGWFCADFAEA